MLSNLRLEPNTNRKSSVAREKRQESRDSSCHVNRGNINSHLRPVLGRRRAIIFIIKCKIFLKYCSLYDSPDPIPIGIVVNTYRLQSLQYYQ